MDIVRLKEILVEHKIFVDDKTKNFICNCPYCGDHPNPSKKGHLYVSKNVDVPVAHCFYCDKAVPIPVLIKDLSGDKELSKEVISDEDLLNYKNRKKVFSHKKRFDKYEVPIIEPTSFINKKVYMQKRTNCKIDIENIPNLIFNFSEMFAKNNLDIVGKNKIISDFEFDMLQRHFVGFLGNHNTIIYCRNSDANSKFKFKKIPLQSDSLLLLDYWSINVENPLSTSVVLSEGNFDLLGAYCSSAFDDIRDDVKVWASGNTFSYSTLLKSVCFDNGLYKTDVTILSDSDKPKYAYYKFLKENKHMLNSCKVYINKSGKDFGVFPVKPSQLL